MATLITKQIRTQSGGDHATFHGTEGVYMLPHHEKEIARLQRQHVFMKTSTTGVLLRTPNVESALRLRVLDAGCADGTWLRDLYNQKPGCELDLHGVDIGSELFPRSSTPIQLHSQNLLQPFPEAWRGTFDVVHQRLLIWGIKSADWPRVIHNLASLLKPGGWIQLVEAEWINAQDPSPLPQLKKQAALQKWSTETFGMDIDIAYKLPELLQNEGLEDVTKFQYNHGYGAKARAPEQRDASAELWVECFRTLDSKIPAGGISGVAADASEFHAFLDELEKEIKTYGYEPKLNFVTAKKP